MVLEVGHVPRSRKLKTLDYFLNITVYKWRDFKETKNESQTHLSCSHISFAKWFLKSNGLFSFTLK
jgi:hypothetical protein